jgi:hypothetical protein
MYIRQAVMAVLTLVWTAVIGLILLRANATDTVGDILGLFVGLVMIVVHLAAIVAWCSGAYRWIGVVTGLFGVVNTVWMLSTLLGLYVGVRVDPTHSVVEDQLIPLGVGICNIVSGVSLYLFGVGEAGKGKVK